MANANARANVHQRVNTHQRQNAQTARRMRSSLRATRATPSASDKAEALCELARDENGLLGVSFAEVMRAIDDIYAFVPTTYVSGKGTNREMTNKSGTNNGSCKTFYFASLHALSEDATLRLFCEHYDDVKANPNGNSHGNIRAFMLTGFSGIEFAGVALVPRDGAANGANDV